MRRIHRSDVNAARLVSYARGLDMWVYPLGRPTDLLCGLNGILRLVEIKNPAKEGHADEFTPYQVKFYAESVLYDLPVSIWRNTDDVDLTYRLMKPGVER